jgi:DNA-binding protein HU-beta|uniref:DNA binding protein n=1 Tax=Siphoviridae sp. cttFh17 TaxID=2826491 RepID=A0A8S5NJB5_9CAUD|nr:MAG TPA: DNA binding protein [Siphoviridae sp. cttFh17]
MNKTDLVKVVKETVSETLEGVTLKDTAVFVDATIKAIQDAVVNGDKVQIVGFGTFETATRAARVGRNPQTGENISIPESKSPKFKAGKAFKDAVKNA